MKRLLVLCCLFAASACAQDFSDVEITTHPIRGPIYALKGAGGTIGVSVGEDGILLVDDQFAPLTDKIKEALGKLNPGEVRFIINTHWHGDHTGGNAGYGDALILGHDNVRKRLIEGNEERPPAAPEAWPVVTFDHTVTVHFNGETIEVMHFPHAHTDGDAVVFFTGSNVVHMADLFFYGAYPYVDLDSGGNVSGLFSAVEAVLAKMDDDTRVIPGHGGSNLEKKDVEAYRDFIRASIGAVADGRRRGLSREALMKEGMPAGFWDKWEEGWIKEDQWIGFVWDSLS